jgi:7,8-dihydropterin-6-yl-methyl-4-(beta-D-ribofuranosyl)aminobenzene 5'-phosphate synthase
MHNYLEENAVLAIILITLTSVILLAVALFYLRWVLGRRKTLQFYAEIQKTKNDQVPLELGEVQSLRILPLIDYFAAGQPTGLETEAGVSYLVQAGDTTLLFDLGYNRHGEAEPPLLRNMQRLGVDLSEIQFIVNSHSHWDHRSGGNAQSISAALVTGNLVKPVFAPAPLNLPLLEERLVSNPQVLAPGVGVSGPLPAQLFLLGRTLEQVLVIHVAGKGLVVMIGCGHPGIQHLVARAVQVFNLPLYAVIGGFHFPIIGDRAEMRVPIQQWLGSTQPPWNLPGKPVVHQAINYLKDQNVHLVSLSAHDSCDWTLDAFSHAFGERYFPLQVGSEILIKS